MERKIKNLRNLILLTLVVFCISLGFLAQACVDLKKQVEALNEQITALQGQQFEIYTDQQKLTKAIDNWLTEWQIDVFESSAYSPLDDRNSLNSWGDGSVMASGAKTIDNIDIAIAVDPAIIPLGTRVWVQGVGWRTALDTGGAIKGNRIDLPMQSFEDAIEYGRKNVLVIYPKKEVSL